MSEEGIAAGAPAPATPFQQTDTLVDGLARYAVKVQDGNLVDFAGRIVKAIANERMASAAVKREIVFPQLPKPDEIPEMPTPLPPSDQKLMAEELLKLRIENERLRATGNAVMIATKGGVYVGAYGNCFFVIDVFLGGYRFKLHCDQSSVKPHIPIKDQKRKLEELADLVAERINMANVT